MEQGQMQEGGPPQAAEYNDGPSKSDIEDIQGKIFIGGLSWMTTDQHLRKYFEKYGELADVALMIDKRSGKPRGFGFIKMKDPAAADIVMLDEHTIDGRVVDVKRALPRDKAPGPSRSEACKIFVGGLAADVVEVDFAEYFSAFGLVKDAVVMVDRNTGSSRGFGFVTFEKEESVETVMKQEHEIHNKYVEVKRAEPRDSRGPAAAGGYDGGGGGYGGNNMGMAEGYASSYGYQNRGNGGGQYPPADQGGRYPPAFQQAYGGRGYQVPAYQYGQMAQAQPNMGYFPGMQVAGGYAGYGAQAAGGAAAYGGAYSGAARADGGDFRSSPQQGGIPGPSEKNGYEGPPHVYHSHGQARPQVQQGAYGLGVFQGQAQVAYQQAQVAGYGAYPAATGQGASPARGPPAQVAQGGMGMQGMQGQEQGQGGQQGAQDGMQRGQGMPRGNYPSY